MECARRQVGFMAVLFDMSIDVRRTCSPAQGIGGGVANRRSGSVARERLSPDTIVDGAIALADAEGLDAVTIRRLAQDHDVTPMALYWHFKDKGELLDGIAERLLADVRLPTPCPKPWPAQLRAPSDVL